MQSGTAKTKNWCLEFPNADNRFIDPVMGWTGSNEMLISEVKLFFENSNQAIEYAEANKIAYELQEPKEPKLKIKSYASIYL